MAENDCRKERNLPDWRTAYGVSQREALVECLQKRYVKHLRDPKTVRRLAAMYMEELAFRTCDNQMDYADWVGNIIRFKDGCFGHLLDRNVKQLYFPDEDKLYSKKHKDDINSSNGTMEERQVQVASQGLITLSTQESTSYPTRSRAFYENFRNKMQKQYDIKKFNYDNESLGDKELPPELKPKLLKNFDRTCVWCYEKLPVINERFWYYGRWYCIAPSEISGLGLYAMEDILLNKNQSVFLMPFYGPKYKSDDWEDLSKYMYSLLRYGININAASIRIKEKKLKVSVSWRDKVYIDGRPKATGNIAGFINSSQLTNHEPNCELIEDGMTKQIHVEAIKDIRAGTELLFSYEWQPLPGEEKYIDVDYM